MKVLIACEESQIECLAFRKVGLEAFSCDLKVCSGDHPEWHFQADAIEILNSFSWDLVIAHPPCTYLSNVQNFRLFGDRLKLMYAAREFFMKFWNWKKCPIAIENPKPASKANLPKYQQAIQPYFFGDHFTKYTCLWLHGLSPLVATNIVKPLASYTETVHGSELRSKSFPGIASAMAEQWGLGKYQTFSLFKP